MSEELTNKQIYDAAPALWKTKLSWNYIIYLHYLEQFRFNKLKAYMTTYPRTNEENARKNHLKVHNKIRKLAPEIYNKVLDKVNGAAKTVEEEKYMMGLEYNQGSKTKAITIARPDLSKDGRKSAIKRVEQSLTAKDPDWRGKITKQYRPDTYFKIINDVAQGVPMNGEAVPASERRKAALDMIALEGFSKADSGGDASRQERKNKFQDQIAKLMAVKVEEGGTLNINIEKE